MSHTPGPWDKIIHEERCSSVGAKTLIAVVYSQNYKDIANQRANTYLIAAAPELLEACKAAKKYLEPDLVEPGRTVFWNLVAAIAKAEGKESPRAATTEQRKTEES